MMHTPRLSIVDRYSRSASSYRRSATATLPSMLRRAGGFGGPRRGIRSHASNMARARDVAYLREMCTRHGIAFKPGDGAGTLQIELFEKFAEDTFMEPTFAYS